MTTHSEYLAGLTLEDRTALEGRLLDRQSGKCFICDEWETRFRALLYSPKPRPREREF